MPVAPWLILTTTLFAPSSGGVTWSEPIQVTMPRVVAARPWFMKDEQSGGPGSTPAAAPHRLGLGGTIGFSNLGAGGAVRYWFGDRVGVDAVVAWYRSPFSIAGSRRSTFVAVPSVIVLLTKADSSRDVNIRPFVGGGPNYVRVGLGYQLIGQPSPGGTGMQAFGGAEVTFKSFDSLAISAELAYYRLPVRIATASLIDGLNYYLIFHYYLK